ncbi:MAG: hypothetical protein ACJ8F1_12080 [Polyangia bacterium]
MKLSKIAFLGLAIVGAAVLSAGCSSTALSPAKHDSGTDVPVVSVPDSGRDTAMTVPHDASDAQTTSTDSGTDTHGSGGCSGHAPAPSEVPPSHRPTAVACAPTPYTPPDGGVSCTSDADCPGIVLRGGRICLHGQCSLDRCLTDADCSPSEACNCSGGPLAIGFRVNACVPASCHVDPDCGPNGYCSLDGDEGTCGTAGYFCHGPNDTCVDATKDCACGQTCRYMPTTGAFACAPPGFCAG